jgi:epsin
MPCIYSQFMEKEARQWRQIYKAYYNLLLWLILLLLIVMFNLQALQLLEYLIKHGSERVVDDARSHLSTIKMLRSFHYIDEKGKDQGINGNVFHL